MGEEDEKRMGNLRCSDPFSKEHSVRAGGNHVRVHSVVLVEVELHLGVPQPDFALQRQEIESLQGRKKKKGKMKLSWPISLNVHESKASSVKEGKYIYKKVSQKG
jgi:hypothetical protein